LGFLNQAIANQQPHPADDSNILILFVVGGISFKEVRQIEIVLKKYLLVNNMKKTKKIILISNKLINIEDIVYMTFS
jgi:hypothetical protein